MSARRSRWDRFDPGPWVVMPILITIILIALPFALGWHS